MGSADLLHFRKGFVDENVECKLNFYTFHT